MADRNPGSGENRRRGPLARSRRRGRTVQTARSRELGSMAITVCGATALIAFGPWMGGEMLGLTRWLFSEAASAHHPVAALSYAAQHGILMLLPVLVVLVIAGIVSMVSVGRIHSVSQGIRVQRQPHEPDSGRQANPVGQIDDGVRQVGSEGPADRRCGMVHSDRRGPGNAEARHTAGCRGRRRKPVPRLACRCC